MIAFQKDASTGQLETARTLSDTASIHLLLGLGLLSVITDAADGLGRERVPCTIFSLLHFGGVQALHCWFLRVRDTWSTKVDRVPFILTSTLTKLCCPRWPVDCKCMCEVAMLRCWKEYIADFSGPEAYCASMLILSCLSIHCFA